MAVVHTYSSAFPYHGPAICRATKGRFNHSLIRFEFTEKKLLNGAEPGSPESRVYFESYWKKDKETGKTGVRGPIPWQDILDWEKKRKTNKFVVQDMPFDTARVEAAYAFAMQSKGVLTYPKYQLVQNLINYYWKHSETEVTCSEWAALCVAQATLAVSYVYILRKGYRTYDEIAPSGPKNGLYEALQKFELDRKITEGIL